MANETILVVDDELLVRRLLEEGLKTENYRLVLAETAAEAIRQFEERPPDMVILDMCLPDGSGLELLKAFKEREPAIVVVMITAHGSVDSAIEALKCGAYDYIEKPFDLRALKHTLRKVLDANQLKKKVDFLEEQQRHLLGIDNIIGRSKAMLAVFEMVGKIAQSGFSTVLIQGENGSGKDLIARAIHDKSPNAASPFLEVNCAALPETLIESELFGYEKGAFTDAKGQKAGLFEVAADGTIVLDEIGEMSLATQAKLLKAIENRKFRRIGGTVDLNVNARVVAATNRDLAKEVEKGRFRQDLYFRLNVIPLFVPPLRERTEDIPELVKFFIQKFNGEYKREIGGVSQKAMEKLMAYQWPGNIRELRNIIERMVILNTDEMILEEHLPAEILNGGVATRVTQQSKLQGSSQEFAAIFSLPENGIVLDDIEKSLITQAIDRARGNQVRAARLLGISRHKLRYRMEKFGMMPRGELNEKTVDLI